MMMPKVEYTAMLLGATGNVGGRILHLLVQSPLCKSVIVVTRRNVAELTNPKVRQVVVNMDKMEAELAPHAGGVDIALAAFGVGKGSAKMADEEVRKIEITYPTAFAAAAKAGGARVLAMMTAAGADSQSSSKYVRNIGDKEKKSEALGYDFLGLYRPAVILGNSNTPSALGLLMPVLHWAMPSRYHSIHKNDLARAMVAQSEEAFLALAQGQGPAAPAVKILEYKEMEPFFVAGDSDASL
ncbi:MAG TPA: NAD(P)H-binding protein [Vicinamibacterales bacterium]